MNQAKGELLSAMAPSKAKRLHKANLNEVGAKRFPDIWEPI